MATRPYLRPDARRRQLLDAAARLFVRDGILGITMVAVAAEAGVSRRLVYDHFTDLTALYEAFFDDRVVRYLDSIDSALEATDSPESAFVRAYAEFLALPVEDQQAIRLLTAGPGVPDLEATRDRLRRHIEARWLPRLPSAEPELARAVLWTLVAGVFGLAEFVSRGELTRDEAIRLAAALVAAVPESLAAIPS